jgi:hypothetical protein
MKRYNQPLTLFGGLAFADTMTQPTMTLAGLPVETDIGADAPRARPDLEGLARRLSGFLAALPPSPANPLDHHRRFGVTSDEHVAALEYVADTNEEFLDVEEWALDQEAAGDMAGAAQAQDILDAMLAEYFANPPDDEDAPIPGRCPDCYTELVEDGEGVAFCPECRNETLRHGHCRPFEDWLRKLGLPFVVVDEAKKSLFTGAAVGSFDFLLYSSAGASLLICLEKHPSTGQLADMKEWESTFGKDFRAVFAWECEEEWVGVALVDWTGNQGIARPLQDWI